MIVKTLQKKYRTVRRILTKDGPVVLAIKALEKLDRTRVQKYRKRDFKFLVSQNDVLKANWAKPKVFKTANPGGKPYTINWVMSPPGEGSGGHQNLFRFIKFSEEAGHTNRIYLYSTIDQRTISEIKKVLSGSYPKTKASIQWLGKDNIMGEADAIFATGWETAYPVYNSPNKARRFYFVQDFEPYFYPIGSEHVLAKNTYKFGFYGITAGGWLAKKLHSEYGMETDYFDFGAEANLYKYTNSNPRKEIFFYARPVTARRGFELGMMTLKLFNDKHPEYTINLAGWDVAEYDIPFPHKNLKTLPLSELSDLYNRCAAGLVMSLTNMSLLPLELLACGTMPVVNDGENNRLVSDNKFISYVANNPAALADKLSKTVTKKDLPEYAKQAAASVASSGWQASGEKFVQILEREISRG